MADKRVWLLNHYAVTPAIGGGTRHYDIAEELAKRGYRVTVFAASFEHKRRQEQLKKKEKYKKESMNGFAFVWIRTYPYLKNDYKRVLNMLSFAYRLFFMGLRDKESPDVIIASSVHPFTCITGYFLARIKRANYIAEIRDLWPQTAVDMGLLPEKSIQVRALRILEKFIYSKAKKIIILLPNAADYINNMGISPDKLVYIPNGVDIKRSWEILQSEKPDEGVNRILENHRNRFTAVYLGAHGEANGLDTLIKSARLIWDKGYHGIDLLLVGDGPEKKGLIDSVRDLGIKNVFFYDSIKKTEIPYLLNKMDLCLFHLVKAKVFKYGVSPNKLFDYLCAAKPVVFACDTSNDIVQEAGCGLSVYPDSPEEMAGAILKIYNMDTEMRNDLGLKGMKYVQKYHDIPVLVDKLETIL